MNAAWLMAVAGPTGLVAQVCMQVVLFRLVFHPRLLPSIIASFVLGGLVTFGISWMASLTLNEPGREIAAKAIVNLATYMALGYGYFHFINLGETARRIRLLRELVDAGGTLTTEEILQRYNAVAIIQFRLDRLVGNRQVVRGQGRLHIGRPTVLWMARLLGAWQTLLLGRPTELCLSVDRRSPPSRHLPPPADSADYCGPLD